MKPSFIVRFSTLALLLFPAAVFATGTLKGVAIDSLTREPLVGAHVLLVGTALGGATDIEGNYAVRSIPAGKYFVRCSYVGYNFKERSVTITDDETVTLNFVLSATVIQGQEILVTGQAQGQVAAINQQLTSNKIVNVISEQKIKELPDANAAEAIGRLPGVSITRSGGEANKVILRGLSESLTTITVDGVQLSATDADSRGIDLSTIAQGSLSGIVLTKAITSDMDGQAIAGNINFVTKTAPETRSVQVTGQGSYNKLDDDFAQYNFYGNYGERFFDGTLGFQAFGNVEKRNRSSENYNVYYDQNYPRGGKYDWLITDFAIQYTPETRKRYGGKVILDARTPDAGVVKLSVDKNRTERRLSMLSRDYPSNTGECSYTFTGQDINIDMLSLALQGENHLYDFQANWSLSFTQSETDMPYNFNLNFLEPSLLDGSGNVISGMKFISPDQRKGPYETFIPYASNNFSKASIQYGYIRTNNNLDFQRTAVLDIKRAYTAFDLAAGEVQFGGKYVAHYHRRASTTIFSPYYNAAQFRTHMIVNGQVVPKDFARYGFVPFYNDNGQILLTNFIKNDTRNLYDKYALTPIFDAGRLRNWYDFTWTGVDPVTGVGEYSPNTTEQGTDYSAFEGVGSAYLMNTLNFGTFATLITGLRVEADNDDYTAFYSPAPSNQYTLFRDTSASHTESIVLPNVHLILKPTDFMNVRLAAFRGINRPDFNWRLPTYVLVGIAPYNHSPMAKIGNPNLKNADAWNYELNLQFYGEKIGLLSLSGFYKAINNQVEVLNNLAIFPGSTIAGSLGATFLNNTRPFDATYGLTFPYNAPKTSKVWGFEAEQQVNFRYLPGLLSGLTLTYNVSLLRNETYTPYGKIVYDTVQVGFFRIPKPRVVLDEQKTRIVNAPEFFCNVVLGYDIGGFSTRLSYFYQGTYYSSFSSDRRADALQHKFERLDLTFKQSITDYLAVGLNINTITNSYEGMQLDDQIEGYRIETSSLRYGTTADLWVRVTL